MKHRLLFAVALLGIVAGLLSAYLYRQRLPTQPPLALTRDPYPNGLYAEGIVQSEQASGDDINVYPEVAGTVVHLYAHPGARVKRGAPLLGIDASVQRRVLAEDIAKVRAARATLRAQRDQLSILRKQASIDRRAVSRLAMVSAEDNWHIARANLQIAIEAQAADEALLRKYVLRAPLAGVVLRTGATVGSYVSAQGIYDTYTQGYDPVAVLQPRSPGLQVKAYLDEILVPRLPAPRTISARLFIRGGDDVGIPLQFVRIDPYVTPKIQLSDQRQEKVDTRVLPIIFRFAPPRGIAVYPGELVDVYIGATR